MQCDVVGRWYMCIFSLLRGRESSYYHILLGHITLAGGCGISLLLIRSISSITLPGGCCRSCSLFISKRFKRPRSAMVSLEQSHCGFFSDRSSCRWAVHLQTLKRPRTIIWLDDIMLQLPARRNGNWCQKSAPFSVDFLHGIFWFNLSFATRALNQKYPVDHAFTEQNTTVWAWFGFLTDPCILLS